MISLNDNLGMDVLRVVAPFIFLFGLSGCPADNGCLMDFTVAGKVVDGLGNPVTDVAVYLVNSNGSEYIIVVTDINGEFIYHREMFYGQLEFKYLHYKKVGYTDVTSALLGKGDGTCNHQIIVRNAVIAP